MKKYISVLMAILLATSAVSAIAASHGGAMSDKDKAAKMEACKKMDAAKADDKMKADCKKLEAMK